MAEGTAAARLSAAPLASFAADALAEAGAATRGGRRARLRIGPRTFDVRFDSAAVAGAILPAWRPLLVPDEIATATPAAELHVITSRTSGPPPAPPWGQAAYRPRDEIDGFGSEQIEVAFQLASGTLILWDAAARRGIWWTRSVEEIPTWERIMPMRALLRWALRSFELALVHGAVVGSQRGGLLLAGAGGAGKSTTALAARRLGLAALADDYAAIAPDGPVAHPLTAFAKATPRTLELLPELVGRLAPLPRTPEGKQAVVLDERPLRSTTGMPLRAIVLPTVGAATGEPEPVGASAAMAALAPTTLFQLPGSRPADQRMLAEIAQSLPAYALTVGPEPEAVAGALAQLLRDAP